MKSKFTIIFAVISAGLSPVISGCGTAKVSRQKAIGNTTATTPALVYVTDFDLDTADIKSEKSLLPSPPKPPGPLSALVLPLPGSAKDTKRVACELVHEMSEALVKDLTKAGIPARRFSGTNNLPATGWLVRGVFTEVNQGNQLRRAIIGFGAGKTDLQVHVDVIDLSLGGTQPFYELAATANSGNVPGAGPMVVLCPAGAAARFVIAAKDLDRNVSQTAARIADAIIERGKSSNSMLTLEGQKH